MDEYYDDEFDETEFKNKKKSRKRNPEGPYHIEMTFKGVKYDITIKNTSYDKFKVFVHSICDEGEECPDEKDLDVLREYLDKEGFYVAARKWNMFYK